MPCAMFPINTPGPLLQKGNLIALDTVRYLRTSPLFRERLGPMVSGASFTAVMVEAARFVCGHQASWRATHSWKVALELATILVDLSKLFYLQPFPFAVVGNLQLRVTLTMCSDTSSIHLASY